MREFGSFRLDTVNQCLWKKEERAVLTPKAFDVLRYLVEHAERLVTQDELLEAIWPDTYVNPEGIRKYILEIRKVLGDRPEEPAYIETFPKRGYQFVAPVTQVRPTFTGGTTVEQEPLQVGRQPELSQLSKYLQLALSGQRQLVFVTGEAGIGKTTLADAFLQEAARYPRVGIARGQCIEGFAGIEPYYPVLEAIGALLQGAESDSLVQMLAKCAPTWLAQFPAMLTPALRESLQREIAGSTRERMVRELCEALEALSAQSLVVIVLEDLHWVDRWTLDLLSAFARGRGAAKVMLLATYRPMDAQLSQHPLKAVKQDLLVRNLCREIVMNNLVEADVALYLSQAFKVESLAEGLAGLIHKNSGGNPLFIRAISADMANKGLIAVDGSELKTRVPLEEVYPGVPETLRGLLEIQLEQLGPEALGMLQVASAIGERFSVWTMEAVLGEDPLSIEQACDRLASRQQFIRVADSPNAAGGAPSMHYEFVHTLYRQVLHGRLSCVQRARFQRFAVASELAARIPPAETTASGGLPQTVCEITKVA